MPQATPTDPKIVASQDKPHPAPILLEGIKRLEREGRLVAAVVVILVSLLLPSGASALPGCGQTVTEVETNQNYACAQQKLVSTQAALSVAAREYRQDAEREPGGTPIREAQDRIEEDVRWVYLLEASLVRIRAEGGRPVVKHHHHRSHHE